jgi:FKBP-type peptidyl-prolyl cis-trans isomerase
VRQFSADAPMKLATRSGLKATDLVIGSGAAATRGATVTVRYSGYLSRGEPIQTGVEARFTLGHREVIAGLEYGVEGMRVGGTRRLEISPHLAYREAGVPGIIPPNAKLVLDVELIDVELIDVARAPAKNLPSDD